MFLRGKKIIVVITFIILCVVLFSSCRDSAEPVDSNSVVIATKPPYSEGIPSDVSAPTETIPQETVNPSTPSPSPSPSQTPAAQTFADDFSDTAFIGNSIMQAFCQYGYSEKADTFCRVGLTVTAIYEKPATGDTKPIMERLSEKQYKRLYLLFGLNELGYESDTAFKSRYKKLIEDIEKLQPDARIYIQLLTPVSEKVNNENEYCQNMERIEYYNSQITELCQEMNLICLDICTPFKADDGFLKSGLSSDGIHMGKEGCRIWADYIKSHI